MTLSLTNYAKVLSQPLLKKARGCAVREYDETTRGHYESYVDEGKESYDVSLAIAPNKDIKEHHCDCGQNSAFCQHKAALLLTIAEGKKAAKTVTAKTAKSKQSKTDLLLEDADAGELKEWVKGLLAKNKDLELAFVQRFGERKTSYTKAEAEAITADAVKSVVKNRTRIEQSELKKIVDLWGDVHEPIVQGYLANVTNEEAFIALHSVLDSCLAFGAKVAATGSKIPNYVQALLNRVVEAVAILHDDEAFESATGFYIKRIPDGLRTVRLHYLQHLQNILAVSNENRIATGVEKLMRQYGTAHPAHLLNGAAYTKTLFTLADTLGLLHRYLPVFKPIQFDNAFNVLLIEKLIAAGELSLAEKYCNEQIAGNYREEYNLPYLRLLQKIYTAQGNEEGIAKVAEKLLPFTFDFDDYLFLFNRMEEGEEKRKWRVKMITKAKNASSHYGNNGAREFHFRVLNHEKAYKKMIDSINSSTLYTIILDYIEPMALTDKQRLLKALLDKSDDSYWGFSQEQREEEAAVFPDLQAALLKHFSSRQLLAAIQQAEKGRFYFRGNRLLTFLKGHLVAE